MKKILFLLTVVIIASSLLVSCSDKAEETSLPPEHQTIEISSENTGEVSQDYPISSSSDITLTGLEKGKLYGIYPETGEARSELMARSTNSSLIPTNGGTYLYYADGGDFTFTGSDVGINGTGSVKLIEYEAETLEQEPTDSDFTIDTETEPCLFENSYGEKVYEEIYAVTIDEGFDPQNIAIALYQKGDASKSDDFGYINPETGKMERNPGRMSFSKGDTVLLFNQVFLREGYTKQTIVIQSPENLELNKTVEVVSQQNIFEINQNTSDEYVLEITGVSKNDLQQLEFHYSAVASIYADGGRRYGNIVPLSYSETTPGTAVLYIGKVDNDILFPFIIYQDLDNVELKLRPIREEEKKLIVEIDPDVNQYKDIPIKADSYFTPIFFNSSDSDTNIWIKMTTDTGSSMRYVASHTSGFGYSQYGLDGGEVAKGRPVDIPECAWIINYENKEGTVRLYFSNSSDFPESGSIMEIDVSKFPSSLSGPVSLEDTNTIQLFNMKPGEVYGFKFPKRMSVSSDDFIQFSDDFYGYVATSSTVEFKLEELGVFADSIQVMKFEKSSELTFDSSTDKPVLTDQDQNLYIKCFDVDLNSLSINRSKVVMLTTQDGKINERPNYYFFDSNTGMQLTFFEEGINDLSALNDILFVYAVKTKEGEKYNEDFTFVSPEEVRAGEKMNLNENIAFILPSSSSEMVIEFDTEYRTNHLDSVWAEGDNVNESCPYFIPLVYNENSSIFYAGCLTDKVLLSLPEIKDASFELREISVEERDMLNRYEIDSLPFEISFTENEKMLTCIFPTDKNPEHAGPEISLETQNKKVYVSVVALPVEGEGYSTRGLDNGIKSETLPENRVIQSIVIENFGGGSGKVIISR